MKGTILDIFFVIQEEQNIFKSEIVRKFIENDPDPEAKFTKYRSLVDIGIAKLEGALFIDCWKEGNKEKYYLTDYGTEAAYCIGGLIEKTPNILFGSKIASKTVSYEEEI